MSENVLNVALVGNPNCGKSTLFNALTGLNQKTGNFPGVTVEKHSGRVRISTSGNKKSKTVNLIDLPGTYSLFPKSRDEFETYNILTQKGNPEFPDKVVIVADASNLKRSFQLCLQVLNLKVPAILALNMIDILEHSKVKIETAKLSKRLGIPVTAINSRDKKGLSQLKQFIIDDENFLGNEHFSESHINESLIKEAQTLNPSLTSYETLLELVNIEWLTDKSKVEKLKKIINHAGTSPYELQKAESYHRFKQADELITDCISEEKTTKAFLNTLKLDSILTHKVWGFAIFLVILFFVFQAIFSWSELPMDWIDALFANASSFLAEKLPEGPLNDLITEGIIPGLGGIFMFIPQIALLFAFITILEDSGYMARVSFIMDRLLKKFGINGKSVIPLISGVACAVPAIMAARTIKNWKERMITIFITPLMSCAARLPVYTLLIAIAVPDRSIGVFNIQGFILLGLYLIGFIAALGTALVLKWIVKSEERSYFIMELPVYRLPKINVIALTMIEKVKIFVRDAGKVIIAISIVLWALSSYGPSNRFEIIEAKYNSQEVINELGQEEATNQLASEKLRNSYAGILGRTIEPVIAPLGFDWKIGIALITSFAAREVFVGTMATIYGAEGEDDNAESLQTQMLNDTHQSSGKPVFTLAASIALILFYAFAMQCMSTLAVVYREMGGWKWPLIQLVYMTLLAWLSAFVAYQLLS